MIEINENTINLMSNDRIRSVFQDPIYDISSGVGKRYRFATSVITMNQELEGVGVIPAHKDLERIPKKKGVKFYKYYIFDPSEQFSFPEAVELYNKELDFDKAEGIVGIDVTTDLPVKVNLIKSLHTAVVGGTGSGKSVFIINLLYQIIRNKHTQLFIVDKTDFAFLAGTKKTTFRSSYPDMANKDWVAYFNYFLLEIARRQKIYEKYNVNDWSSYQAYIKAHPEEDMEKLNLYYVVIDEYQSIRSGFGDNGGNVEVFDSLIKAILDTCRSAGMIFYFGTQDYKVANLGSMLSSIPTTYVGKVNYHKDLKADETKLVSVVLNGTYLFFDPATKAIIKVPHSDEHAKKQMLIDEANDDKNIYAPIKQYTSLSKMLNDALQTIKSDIFENMDGFMKEMKIKDQFIKDLKKSSEYIPFSILFYSIYRLFKLNTIRGKNTDMFANIDGFEEKIDQTLFSKNIEYYKDNKKLINDIESTFEDAQDPEVFIEHLSEVFNNHLNTILGQTSFVPQIDTGPSEDEKKKIELPNSDSELISAKYVGEIKPTSFNGMYFPDKEGNKRISQEAKKYEKTIRDKLVGKMVAKEIKQTKKPVILDIEFTLGLKVKKDGDLSKAGRNDVDNLLKATIDGIQKSIIADDNQVYCIRTKINYIEKQNSQYKNNKVFIRVLELTKDTYKYYLNKFDKEGYNALTPKMYIPLEKGLNIKIPSANNMYFYNKANNNKPTTSSNTLKYKSFLGKYIQNNYEGAYRMTTNECAIFLDFSAPNMQADLDNMLKATIDSFSKILYEDDVLVKEIICVKRKLKSSDYSGTIDIQVFDYNVNQDIISDESDNYDEDDIFIPTEIIDDDSGEIDSVIEGIEDDNEDTDNYNEEIIEDQDNNNKEQKVDIENITIEDNDTEEIKQELINKEENKESIDLQDDLYSIEDDIEEEDFDIKEANNIENETEENFTEIEDIEGIVEDDDNEEELLDTAGYDNFDIDLEDEDFASISDLYDKEVKID